MKDSNLCLDSSYLFLCFFFLCSIFISSTIGRAGGPINIDSISHGVESSFGGTGTYLSIPPLCMITNQEIVNKKVTTLSNDVHTLTVLRREAIAVTATISESLLVICFFEIDIEVESVISRKY